MDKFNAEKLPQETVAAIRGFIQDYRDALSKNNTHFNRILREDIFPLLDQECTVIYFPTEDKQNNGFHVTYPFKDETIHFVYINTSQYREKQIFTAAHELGHIKALDEFLRNKYDIDITPDYCERIMNRFAAELLMPHEIFKEYADRAIREAKRSDSLTVAEMLDAITSIMNEFFVPYKSVVFRLYELDFIEEDVARLLWGEKPNLPRVVLEEYSQSAAQAQGFGRLYKADQRRSIDGLKELLDAAKEKDVLPTKWLEAFYSRFKLERKTEDDRLDQLLPSLDREDTADA